MKDVKTEVSLRKIGRHTQKPTVETSLGKVKRLIKRAKTKIEDGEAYAVYACGHILNVKEDPNILTYYIGQNRSIRSCPKCITEKLLVKYKRCGCGAEHASKRVQPSNFCSKCTAGRRAQRPAKHNLHLRNRHLADPKRCHCIHRDECIVTYIEYDAIPCRGCTKYSVGQGVHDPLTTENIRIS